MIPCEECIAYAACRQRELIECDRLYSWLDYKFEDGNSYFSGSHTFKSIDTGAFNVEICKYFPNTLKVFIGVPNNSGGKRRVYLSRSERQKIPRKDSFIVLFNQRRINE